MFVGKAELALYVGYDDNDVLIPGLVTKSEEADDQDENTIHLEGFLRQGYLDCGAYSDVRNDLAGVYFVGRYDDVMEMRKVVMSWRNVKPNLLCRRAFRYDTTLTKPLQEIYQRFGDEVGGIVIRTQDDGLLSLVNLGDLGMGFKPMPAEPWVPRNAPDNRNWGQLIDSMDVYQVMALYGKSRTYELGLVPSDNPDKLIHVCNSPFKK